MRGKVLNFSVADFPFGITPAYAGKSPDNHRLTFAPRDHPRLCGEKHLLHQDFLFLDGSPPPMRGKAIDFALIGLNFRITPAYAGKRIRFFGSNSRRQDHPRLCGEKPLFLFWHYEKLGSPPPMRGKVQIIQRGKAGFGITPAYAGKRQGSYFKVSVIEDHPRLCGEKLFLTSQST